VVEALLNFSRSAEPRMNQTDINTCIEEVVSVLDLQLQKDRFTVERRFDTTLPLIKVDGNKIKQVLMNLLINATQAMPEGGRIIVRTALAEDHRQLEITISDTGPGIPKDNISKIFDPFFTTKGPEKGTGLGLSVSYGIVQQHGGRITVDSASGQGTTFTICLPVDGAPA
jgi:two-component system NtrC family sensor kinase